LKTTELILMPPVGTSGPCGTGISQLWGWGGHARSK